jgi:cell division septation protein DedD
VAKNEDGEFELILGNRQLLGVFFIGVVLLGLCFLMGYVVGRNSAPVLNADSGVLPAASTPAATPAANPAPESLSPAAQPVQTTAQQPSASGAAPKTEPPPAAPPPTAAGPQPPAGMYLQLSATSRDEAEALADLLRSRRFAAVTAEVPGQPTRLRVLVGPLPENAIDRTRAELKAANFPGDDAIPRRY